MNDIILLCCVINVVVILETLPKQQSQGQFHHWLMIIQDDWFCIFNVKSGHPSWLVQVMGYSDDDDEIAHTLHEVIPNSYKSSLQKFIFAKLDDGTFGFS